MEGGGGTNKKQAWAWCSTAQSNQGRRQCSHTARGKTSRRSDPTLLILLPVRALLLWCKISMSILANANSRSAVVTETAHMSLLRVTIRSM